MSLMMLRHSLIHILMNTYCHFCAVGLILPEDIGSKCVLCIAWVYGRLHQIPDLCAIEFLCVDEVPQTLAASRLPGSCTELT